MCHRLLAWLRFLLLVLSSLHKHFLNHQVLFRMLITSKWNHSVFILLRQLIFITLHRGENLWILASHISLRRCWLYKAWIWLAWRDRIILVISEISLRWTLFSIACWLLSHNEAIFIWVRMLLSLLLIWLLLKIGLVLLEWIMGISKMRLIIISKL